MKAETGKRPHPPHEAEDAIFWDRLHAMPAWEAEQECVLRREGLALENAMLNSERARINPPIGARQKEEFAALGVALMDNAARFTKLNERIRYLRKLQDTIHWKEAVSTLYGTDAAEECVVWIEQRWAEVYGRRREWAAEKKASK